MKGQILSSLDNPKELERLYRSDKSGFRRAFKTLSPEVLSNPLFTFWTERLSSESEEFKWGTSRDLTVVVILAALAGLVAKLPFIFGWSEEFFFTRNIGFVVFPALMCYFAWRHNLPWAQLAKVGFPLLAGIVFINWLPDNPKSDTLVLSCIHIALFLWALLGFVFVSGTRDMLSSRLAYLKYNGDLLVMCGLILISGFLMTGITIGLFDLIGLDIKDFYFKYIVIVGLAAVPVVGTYLTQTNPGLVGKVTPVIARIFSPIVLVMLFIYLVAIVYTGKDPYNDREFLLLFNGLLVGVMAIIFFSVTETVSGKRSAVEKWVLFLLSTLTIIVNGIALSAILFRISEWGITPNRAAVLGGNLLILINLLLVTVTLFKVVSGKQPLGLVGGVIARYLPVYVLWTIIVTFVFPLLFSFK